MLNKSSNFRAVVGVLAATTAGRAAAACADFWPTWGAGWRRGERERESRVRASTTVCAGRSRAVCAHTAHFWGDCVGAAAGVRDLEG